MHEKVWWLDKCKICENYYQTMKRSNTNPITFIGLINEDEESSGNSYASRWVILLTSTLCCDLLTVKCYNLTHKNLHLSGRTKKLKLMSSSAFQVWGTEKYYHSKRDQWS